MNPRYPKWNPSCTLYAVWCIDAAKRNAKGEDNRDECGALCECPDSDASDVVFAASSAVYCACRVARPYPATIDDRREAAAWWLKEARARLVKVIE